MTYFRYSHVLNIEILKNIVLTKKTSAVFLAIVLFAGTIALSSPSFMVGDVQAQRDYGMDSYDKKPYENNYEPDYGNDNRYDSYEPEYTDKAYNSYEQDYGMDKAYNSYEQDYGMDKAYNSYEQDYGMDNDKKPQIFPANKVAELGDRWWQWIVSLNNVTDPNPFTETGQAGCDVGLQDDGRLLFLVGSPSDPPLSGTFPVHDCKIKEGTSILFPIVNVFCAAFETNPPQNE